ncbi:hypothetical protein [Nocardia sp. NPDC004711]
MATNPGAEPRAAQPSRRHPADFHPRPGKQFTQDRATELDRQWFDANPSATWYVRTGLPGEFVKGRGPMVCPPTHRYVVFVERGLPPEQSRSSIGVAPLPPDENELPAELLAFFAERFTRIWRRDLLP